MAKLLFISKDDMNNGDGLRVVEWLAGCAHNCEGCQNAWTQDPERGMDIDDEQEIPIWEQLKQPYISGLTLSGGDPLYVANRKYSADIAKRVKERYPNKTVYLYTGYRMEFKNGEPIFTDHEIDESFSWNGIEYIDVIIDGRFDINTRRGDIEAGTLVRWRGSSNQRVIDVKETLAQKRIVVRMYRDDDTWVLV